MRCLYCGKEIKATATEDEKNSGWHSKFIKMFFGTKKMPILDISEEQLEQLATESVNKGLTVPGVQKKLSLHLHDENESRLTIIDYPTGYILKPQTEEYRCLPEFEDLAMRMATIAGIRTVPHALVKLDGRYAYITKRVDRVIKEDCVKLYAMEDFCQLSERQTVDKYKGSYEKCGRIVKEFSEYPGIDLSELFLRLAFSFIIGNSDMHLKNFSLRETEPGNRNYRLSEAYDMLPVNIVLPEDEDELALTLNGKRRKIRRKDFEAFAINSGIVRTSADKMLYKLCSLKQKFIEQCENSYLPTDLKEKLKELIVQRIAILENAPLN